MLPRSESSGAGRMRSDPRILRLVASRYNRMLPAVFRLVRSVQHQAVVPMASDLRLFAIEYPISMRS